MDLDRALLRLASVVVLGTIMSILDTTIVNVAIETLGRDLDASLSSIQWVSTGLPAGAGDRDPADRLGDGALRRQAHVDALGDAVPGRLDAVRARLEHESLIVFRVLQGFGGGMIMPIGQAILAQAAGPQRMGRMMSVIGVPTLLGPILGPVIGGLIVDNFSWRWIFFVNLPVGAGRAGAGLRGSCRAAERDARGAALDVRRAAAALAGAGVAGLRALGVRDRRAAFDRLPRARRRWSSALVLLVAFVFHASRAGERALIDLSLFRDRAFAAASGTTFIFGVSLFGAMLILPLYYQVVRGESALDGRPAARAAGGGRGDGDADRGAAHRPARARGGSCRSA